MTTLADSLVDAASRPLHLRMRPDLKVRRHFYLGRPFWVVKEPVGLKYFRFEEEEFAILEMLDGEASMESIKKQFEREYAPQKIAFGDLQHFIGNLYRSGLLVADAPGQGEHLYQRYETQLWQKFVQGLANLLALRFRGIDPERLLNFLYVYFGWFFTRWAVMANCAFGLSALTLVVVQFESFRQKLPAFNDFFGAGNWLWLAVTLASVKILHEFGHGLSCKHFGGECHEMGFMMLVLTPCLYCNVSDSWMLPNKWHRAAIGAAGMYVELFLASCATYLWWFSEPGLLNFICLRVMFVCSVSTVMFNGNPLMRYDGYYILSDILEIPNLRQKSSDVLRRMMLEWCLGLEQPEDPFLPQRNQFLFALFTVAAVIYRWVVMFSIFLFLNRVLEPYGLKPIGQAIAIGGILGLVVQPLYQLYKFLHIPGRVDEVKRLNLAITLLVLAGIGAFIVYCPLPHWVHCSFEVEPRDASTVYATVPGTLEEILVKPGDAVQSGQVIARLRNPELKLARLEVLGRLTEARMHLDGLRLQRQTDPEAASLIADAQKSVESYERLLAAKEEQIARLVVKAPCDGIVMPSPEKQSERGGGDQRLPNWSGSLFEARNLHARLQTGEVICLIGDPKRVQAVLVVDQADVDFVTTQQTASLLLDAYPDKSMSVKIEEIAATNLKVAPTSLTNKAGGDVATRTDATGAQTPLSASYQARAPLDNASGLLQMGLRGRAKIWTHAIPAGSRIWRYLARTFHFKM